MGTSVFGTTWKIIGNTLVLMASWSAKRCSEIFGSSIVLYQNGQCMLMIIITIFAWWTVFSPILFQILLRYLSNIWTYVENTREQPPSRIFRRTLGTLLNSNGMHRSVLVFCSTLIHRLVKDVPGHANSAKPLIRVEHLMILTSFCDIKCPGGEGNRTRLMLMKRR